MSSTTGAWSRGSAMMSGLFPSFEDIAPHGGMFGVVLVQPMKAKPASAACQPYVPPRIQ